MSPSYPILRSTLRPEYAEASDDVIETVVSQIYGEHVSAEDAESFLGGIGHAFSNFGRGVANVARQAGPVLGNALPGMASGAATGAALGPWGALAGAAIGGVASALAAGGSHGRPAPRHGGGGGTLGAIAGAVGPSLQALGGGGGAAGGVGRIAGLAGPALQAIAGGRSGAASPIAGAAGQALAAVGGQRSGGLGGTIAGLMARPEVQNALLATLQGSFGRQQVSVGGRAVPTAAVMNMLGSLFSRAATESVGRLGDDESMPEYLMDDEGEYQVDPADPDARAAWLAQLIGNTPCPGGDAARRQSQAWASRGENDDEAWDDEAWDDEGIDDEGFDDEGVAVTYSLQDLDDGDESDVDELADAGFRGWSR